jgi:hypothetical protein
MSVTSHSPKSRDPKKGAGREEDAFSDIERLDREELDDDWTDSTAVRRLKKAKPQAPDKKSLSA